MKLEGRQALVAKLKALPDKIARKALRNIARAGSEPIRSRMSDLAPKGDPGAPNLSDVVVMVRQTPGDPLSMTASIGPAKDAYYGVFQEYGTRYHGPQAFARPAFDEENDAAQTEAGAALWQALKDEVG